MRHKYSSVLHNFAYLLLSLIEVILGFRVVLRLFGANTSASFVAWLYDISEPLLTPFLGAFPAPAIEHRYVIEFSTLFAMLVYGFIGYLFLEFMSRDFEPKGKVIKKS